MRLVVHIGATKTASTYLQKCLTLNDEILRKHGLFLPEAGRRTPIANHHNLAWHLLGDRRFRENHGTWEALCAEIAEADADVVLLSSEAFARLASEEQLRPAFARRLAQVADNVSLVYVVRDPLSRINSMYTQAVKTFANPESFDEYATKSVKSGFYNLEDSFKFWYDGNRVRFQPIRFDEFIKTGPLQSLLRTVDVEVPAAELTIPDDVANPSPGPVAVEAMRLLNAHLRVIDPAFSRRSEATMKLSQVTQRRAGKLGWFDERFWGWDSDRAMWAANRLSPSNERFARAVWGIPWPLDTPIAKQMTAIALIDQRKRVRKDVEDYVSAMTRRYVKLLENPAGSDDADDDEDGGVGDLPGDEFTVDADEAERAGEALRSARRSAS